MTDAELEILSKTFLFNGIDSGEVSAMLEECGCETRAYRKGEVIYSPESFRRELGIVLHGVLTVTKGSFTVSELGVGDLFGAAALYTDETRYVSTLTARRASRVLFISQEGVEALIDRSAAVRENYIRYLAQRIRFLSAKVDALTSGTGERKLSDFLLKNADGAGVVTVRSLTELASRLGIARASLYRQLDRLMDDGIIAKSGKTITVLKPESLVLICS